MSHEYTCKIDKAGRRRFYHRGEKIHVGSVPKEFIDDIVAKALDSRKTIEEDELAKTMERLRKLIDRRRELDIKIASLQKEIEEKRKKIATKKQDIPKETLKNLRGEKLFQALGIQNEKDWKKWLLLNHPDRNPEADQELVSIVNNEARMYLQKK